MERSGEPVAIIGTSCRFPGDSTTPSKFWELLREPHDLLKPHRRGFDSESWYSENGKHHGRFNVKQAYQLDGDNTHSQFDAPFFGISAVEANTMDPQMRLLLETVYEALEAGGQSMERLRGSDTAVYTGMMSNGYQTIMERDMLCMGTYHASGVSRTMMSNRLSYVFDWHGPSMTIDTACSSSMVAVHQAVMQLRTGQSHVAVAAGANLILDPADYIGMSNLDMLSPDSRSRMWDANANGYARGEGVAAVVLKLLSAAEADGDHIECIIRETAINQDGRTKGITMPSSTAQAQLISDCYARAGLDLLDPTQRPQYFEAHGTGTPAGDPIEAEAIKEAFFPIVNNNAAHAPEKLFVGSVKTVIGHSESVAGLAALIKTSLVLQNSLIPPNLLLQEINPKVLPFYGNLQIPSTAVPWPRVPDGCPRRASVNSFGFGGANSHAIVESYIPNLAMTGNGQICCIPFVFSAASTVSLAAILANTRQYLMSNTDDVSLRDLALTMYLRRSRHAYGIAIAASSLTELRQKLEKSCYDLTTHGGTSINIRSSTQLSSGHHRKPRILAIFTGQGAQCSRMGAAFIERSVYCRDIVDRLEARLASLPEKDRPSWSLRQELLEAPAARINKASISQPLCTALQIMQVELMRRANVDFSAVVGHSSGEISAAYCAGMITADEAICIAYYRGLISERASHAQPKRGAMIAVATTLPDAQELCEDDDFKDRVCVAAVNSPTSITLSGDSDAVEHLHTIFKDEGKIVRSLQVDQAYHSFHMETCAEEYVRALEALNIEPKLTETPWFSSVDGGTQVGTGYLVRLRSTYWGDNMVQPVMFMQAIDRAWKSCGPFDMAVELGPHPALKRPALETMQELHGQKIPYTGVHARGKDAVEAFADALGLLWAHVASANLTQYDRYVTGQADYIPVVGLPPYAWDHPKQYWHESRYAKAIRTQPGPPHELLGHLTPDSNDKDMKWRKVLCPDEIPWLKNHAIEGQAIFPAAGYVVLAVEATAAMVKAKGLLVSLIEVRDLDIGKALAFGSADTRMEIVVALNIIHQRDHTITASFHLHAAPILSDGSLNLLASGSTAATLGDSNSDALPSTRCLQTGLSNINYEDYYQSLSSLGYDYAEQFRALRGLKRKFRFASGSIQVERSAMLVHPAVLDASFQSMFLANCAPHTGGIWSLHVPKTIRLVRVNPSVCAAANGNNTVSVECTQPKDVPGFECDVDIFSMDGDLERCMIQVQGLSCVPLTRPTVADDREMFATVVWDVAVPDGNRVTFDGQPTEHKIQLASLLERLSVFYLKTLCINVPEQHPSRQTDPYQHYFNFASHILSQATEGTLPYWSSKWTNDSYDDVRAASEAFLEYPDVQLLQAIGENIVDIATGKTLAIEIGMRNDMLARIYEFGLGFQEYSIFLGRLVKQIAHRHPGMNIIEVGAGTGVATKRVFSEIGKTFSSYTFTDISSGFFERAKGLFSSHQSAMLYKVLDISRDVASQGFNEHSYDMVVVSAVLHATPDLRVTLSNVRRLLKPGGFLVAVEGQPTSAMLGTIFGSLPGWWLGANDGRRLSPCVDLPTWDTLLRATGFSGCDTKIQSAGDAAMPMTAFVSQAVDDRVNFLRHPSSTPMALFQGDNLRREEELLILGSRVAQSLLPLLQSQWGNRIRTVDSLAALDISLVGSNTTILSLLDLDTPLFGNLQSDTWVALRTCLQQANTILWVSFNRRCENPHANMMIGLLRSVKHEIPTIAIQSLDFESPALPSAQRIADALVAFKAALMWQQDGNMFSTIEPEIVIDTDGTPLIPRMKPDQTMNNRYNSPRRPIFSNSSCHRGNGNIALAGFDGTRPWQQHAVPPTTPKFTIQVTRSLQSALYIPKAGFMNLVLGRNPESDEQVVALTTQPTLHVIPVVTVALPMPVPAAQEAAFLSLLAYQLISKLLASEVSFGTTVVVHNKEEEPLISILRDTTERNVLSLKIGLSPQNNYIHPMTPDRKLRQMIPSDTSVFCDLSIGQSGSAAGARLRAHLPSNCRVYDRSSIFAVPCSSEFPHAQQSAYLVALLRDCVSRCHAETAPFSALSYADGGHLLETVKWPAHASDVQVRVRPADSNVGFSTNRTYWLCGLSGGLGLLLCEWMIDRGARHVVISSRSPKVEEQWLVRMRNLGADVRIFACDITDRAAVQGLYRQIKSSLPQVAGICQGAMVLEDVAVGNMSIDSMLKVTRPKVLGSIHMDELFQTDDLEFFILFSSVSSILGNIGQANYGAGNMFMSSLAERRRRRGLSASVMHIGPISGAGYISDRGLDSHFHKMSLRKAASLMSERDFFQHFAEAVMAGRPESNSPDITSGLARVESAGEIGPLLSHMVIQQASQEDTGAQAKPKASLRSQLLEVRASNELELIIREALLSRLSVVFQMELSAYSQAQCSITRLDEMGTDSLMAIDIRSWFVKELQVNIPVLKILSGVTISDLIATAVETIPNSLVPKLSDEQRMGPKVATETDMEDGTKTPTTESFTSKDSDSGSATLTEPTPFLGDQDPVELLFEKDSLTPPTNEQVPNISPAVSLNDSASASLVTSPHSHPDHSAILSSQLKEAGQMNQLLDVADEKVLELSFSQSLFYFSAAFAVNPTHLNLTSAYRMTGTLCVQSMKDAVLALGNEHESLRTRFFVDNSRPMQAVMESSLLRLEHYTIQHESELETYVNDIHSHVYDLERGDTMRLAVVSTLEGRNFVIMGTHHLSMDGQSALPFMKGLMEHYTGTPTNYGTRPLQYSEMSEKQHADFRLGRFEKELTYWKNELADPPPPLPIMRMSSLVSRPVLRDYGNRHWNVRIRLETKKKILLLCRRYRVTPFHFYLAIYRVLIYRYTGAEEFAIGIGDANRTEECMMEGIGAFVNVLPILLRTDSQQQFEAILTETRSKTHAALEHSRLPFHLLLSELGIARSATTTPIFQAFMDYRLVGETMGWKDFSFELQSFKPSIMAYDVAVDIFDNPGGDCRLTFIVRDDIYSQVDVEQLAESYICLVDALTRWPEVTISEPQMFEESKMQMALDLGRGPIYESRQWGHTVVHRIDEIVKQHPTKTAVVDGNGVAISYHDLFQDQVNKIAVELDAVGATSGARVAVLQEPLPTSVATILAIWKIGGTYIPLDLRTPGPRRAAIIEDSQPQLLLVDEYTREFTEVLELENIQVIDVSKVKNSTKQIPNSVTVKAASAILYTSGSTGTPKGIVLTHRGIQSWLQPCALLYALNTRSRVLQQSSQGFDMSLMQMLTALCFGGSVYLLPRELLGDARAIVDMITRQNITHTFGTPSEYLSWLRFGDSLALRHSSWTFAVVGGEPLTDSVLKEFATLDKPDLRFHHMYGTSESTFCASVMELDYRMMCGEDGHPAAARVSYPAGVTLPNYNMYVLDEHQRPLPPGFKGEIFIGGGGVAQGYLNNPSLTAETFLPDPFATADDHARGWNMMQRTGDMGRWSRTEHGAIIIEGRVLGDTMVKLRGLRVDLRDIEMAMLRAGGGLITDVVVSVRQTSPDLPEFLVAHVLVQSDLNQDKDTFDFGTVRTKMDLPLSMKPAFIIPLDSLPMTSSGKLDRRAINALPLMDKHVEPEEIALTTTEERLKHVWEDALHDAHALHIKPNTDFFHVGGTSLLLLGLRDKIKTEFEVELSLVDLFETSTLSTMASRIEGRTSPRQLIDWDQETALSAYMSDHGMFQPVHDTSARVIIITGATGYLGKALVEALTDDPTIDEIHCLAVRNASSRAELNHINKVIVHEGDLGQVRLGLSQALIDDLFGRAHLVIHNGADTSYMKTYHSMRQSNYQTTRDLIEWCVPRMVPFHYISTAGVGCYAPGSSLCEASMRSTPPPLVGDLTGYTACKWASEVFLENVVRRCPEWPVYVHRPTLISRDDIPQLDAVHNILGFARKLGAVASAEGVASGVMNVVTLEAVVTGITKCLAVQNQDGGVHFVNHAGTLELPLNDMRKWALERTAGGDVRLADVELAEIHIDEWIQRAVDQGMHPTMAVLLRTFARHGEVEFPVVVTSNI